MEETKGNQIQIRIKIYFGKELYIYIYFLVCKNRKYSYKLPAQSLDFHRINHMKQESIISSCQASGPSPGLGCIFEAADTLLQSERQRLLSEVCACSPRPPHPSVYNDPPLPRPPRSPGGTSGKESACQCRRHQRCRFDPLGLKDPLGKDVATHSSILSPGEFRGRRSLVGYHPMGHTEWTMMGATQHARRGPQLHSRLLALPPHSVYSHLRASAQTVSITWPALLHPAHTQPLQDGPHILIPRGWVSQ